MAELAILNDEQLRVLAEVIYNQEAAAIQNIKFASEPELAKYLGACKANYDSVLALLDRGRELELKFQKDNTLGPVAIDIASYVVNCANSALQTVPNYTLRTDYLRKIGEHVQNLVDSVEELAGAAVANVSHLAEVAAECKEAMLEFTKKYGSNASHEFSKWIKESGFTYEQLVQRYQTKLNLPGAFQDLDDVQKIEVYNEILEASGRGRVKASWLKSLGVAGIAVMLFNIGLMVWEIFASDHFFQAATHEAVVLVASIGGAMLGEVVGAALATNLLGVVASSLFVVAAGIVGGIVGAFIIGEFAGWLIDLIIGSGGTAPLSTEGHKCYVASMPDGIVLARQIAHS